MKPLAARACARPLTAPSTVASRTARTKRLRNGVENFHPPLLRRFQPALTTSACPTSGRSLRRRPAAVPARPCCYNKTREHCRPQGSDRFREGTDVPRGRALGTIEQARTEDDR